MLPRSRHRHVQGEETAYPAVTLLPVEEIRVQGAVSFGYLPLPPVCQAPGCIERATERHHVLRRSWSRLLKEALVVLIDGAEVPAVVCLCKLHHDELTGLVGGHKSALAMPPADGIECGLYSRRWVWYTRARPAVPGLRLPARVLKSGAVLWPIDYVKEVSNLD